MNFNVQLCTLYTGENKWHTTEGVVLTTEGAEGPTTEGAGGKMGYTGWRKSNFAILGGRLGQFALNHSIARPIFGEFDYNDYRSMGRWSDSKLFGSIASARKTEMENEENERYWQDMSRYYGFNPDNLPYPIRSGRYGHVSGGNTVSGGFEATKSVMSLYKPLPRR